MRWIPLLICLAVTPIFGCDAGKQPYQLAVAAEARKDYDAALANYQAVLAHPDSSFVAKSQERADELAGKIERVKSVLKAVPDLETRGAYDEALSNLQGAETVLPGYAPTATATTRVKKTFAGVLLMIGDMQRSERKFVEAEATYKKVFALYPGDPAVAAKLKALAEERAIVPYLLQTPMSARIADVQIAGSTIAFTLFNAILTNDHGGKACFRVHPEWTAKNGQHGRLDGRSYELPNGQSRPVEFAFPEGRIVADEAEQVILVVEETRCGK